MVTEDTDIGRTVGRGDCLLAATALHAGHGLRAAALACDDGFCRGLQRTLQALQATLPGLLEELARA